MDHNTGIIYPKISQNNFIKWKYKIFKWINNEIQEDLDFSRYKWFHALEISTDNLTIDDSEEAALERLMDFWTNLKDSRKFIPTSKNMFHQDENITCYRMPNSIIHKCSSRN